MLLLQNGGREEISGGKLRVCRYRGKPDIGWGIDRIIEDDEETATRPSLASKKWKT